MRRRNRPEEQHGWAHGWAFPVAVALVRPLVEGFTRPAWVDGDKLPASGGALVAANHISHVDPLTFAHFVYDNGRLPHYLAKAELFDLPVLGALARATGQIPVRRDTGESAQALSAAVEAVRAGQLVVVYPEGTITRQPDLWPMAGRTGAARIALSADAPVIPAAQWGAHRVLYPYTKRARLLPRQVVHAKAGDPVDLEDLRGVPLTPDLLREATERIMSAITGLLEDLRGEPAPVDRYPWTREPRRRRR